MSFGVRAKAKIILTSIKISYYYMIKIGLAPSHHRKEVKTTSNFLKINILELANRHFQEYEKVPYFLKLYGIESH